MESSRCAQVRKGFQVFAFRVIPGQKEDDDGDKYIIGLDVIFLE